MLYGTVIVIKRNGQDGSKFPVTEKEIKIGTSPGCPILINTPFVTGEHCKLVVEDDCQVKIQNLSTTNPIGVNGTTVEDEIVLSHCDIVEIGGRIIRWEYPNDSAFYQEISPPSIAEVVEVNDLPEESAEPPQPESSNMLITPKKVPMPSFPKTPDSTKKIIRLTPKMMTVFGSRKSLQPNKALFSPANSRRKSEAIRVLSGEDLHKMVSVNSQMKKMGTITGISGRVSSPFSSQRVRVCTTKPLLNTIGENGTKSGESSIAAASSLGSIKQSIEDDAQNSNEIEQDGVAIPDDNIPLTPPNSKTTESGKSPVKEIPSTPIENISINLDCTETPPEVKTPLGSPKALSPQMPITPMAISRILADQVSETPPEVVTPETLSPLKKMKLSPQKSLAVATDISIEGDVAPLSPRRTPRATTPKRSPAKLIEPAKTANKTPSTVNNEEKIEDTPKMAEPVEEQEKILETPSPIEKENKEDDAEKLKVPDEKVEKILKTPSSVKKNKKQEDKKILTTPVSVKKKQEKTPSASKSLKTPVKTPNSAKKAKTMNSTTKKMRSSPRGAKTEATPSPKQKKTVAVKNVKNVGQAGKKKTRMAAINARVANAFGIKSKIPSTPDKNKTKALLVLGKAVKSKAQTEMNMRKKLLKKAIQTKNQRKAKFDVDNLKSPPAVKSPVATPVTKPRTPGNRSSKRISQSKGESRPDFTELSPRALGLAPRASLKTPTPQKKRNSPKISPPSDKRLSRSAKSEKLSIGSDSTFDYATPNISEENFVSPLCVTPSNSRGTPRNRRSNTSVNLMEFFTPAPVSETSPRKRAQPVPLTILEDSIVSAVEDVTNTSGSSKRGSVSPKKVPMPKHSNKSPKNSYLNVAGVKALFTKKSPRNDLTKVTSIRKLMKTPPAKRTKKATVKRAVKSPKNDLTDVKGVKEMFGTEEDKVAVKSPLNDLTDVRGVRNLFTTPKNTKSPKNDLRVVSGLRELFASPSEVPDEQEVATTPVVKKRARGLTVGTPRALDSPLRRGRSSTAAAVAAAGTPQARSLRTQVANIVAEADETEVPKVNSPRGKRKTAAKQESPPAKKEESAESSLPSPPKRGRKPAATAAPKTPTVRGRSRRVTAPTEDSNKENETEAKPTRGRGRTATAKATPAKKKASPAKTSPSPSPVKRTTRARAQTTKAKPRKKKADAETSPVATQSPKGKKTAAKASAKASPSPKKRTRGTKAQPVAEKSPSPVKRVTRGRAAATGK